MTDPTRNTYYVADPNGYLAATVYMTDAEAALNPNLLTTPPPPPPAPVTEDPTVIAANMLTGFKQNAVQRVKQTKKGPLVTTITVGSYTIKADPVSLLNLIAKSIELSCTAVTQNPTTFTWRDASDVIQSFPDLPTYQAWVNEAIALISQARSAAYLANWTAEDTINAATNHDDVQTVLNGQL